MIADCYVYALAPVNVCTVAVIIYGTYSKTGRLTLLAQPSSVCGAAQVGIIIYRRGYIVSHRNAQLFFFFFF